MTPADKRDFFVSYTQADRAWAEWIAWTLEENGYQVLIQAWDIPPGANWIHEMDVGVQRTDRTIAVMSEAYRKSVYCGAEWQAAWAADPTGKNRKLLVVRVEPTHAEGLLTGLVYSDLFGLAEADAKTTLLNMAKAAITQGRTKPEVAPGFPGADRAIATEPRFPVTPAAPSTGNWTGALAAVLDADDDIQGTAFFVGRDIALTALDAVVAAGETTAKLVPAGAGSAVAIVEVDRNEALGLALLRVEPSHDGPWVVLSGQQAVAGHDVLSTGFMRGYPLARYPGGLAMTPARVLGESQAGTVGRVKELVLDAVLPAGMAGAPAVDADTGAVIGSLRTSEGRTVAVLAEQVRRCWPGLPTVTGGPGPVFASVAAPASVSRGGWDEFDPGALHCLVVGSESLSGQGRAASLAALVKAMLSDREASKLWAAFRQANDGRELLRSGPRMIPSDFSSTHVQVASFDVADAFSSRAGLERVVRLVVQADLALFDVTNFEPGVMLLLGIRAATRRGLTINSHGGGWLEGEPLLRPFNLSDLSLSSHTPSPGHTVGQDVRIGRLMERICNGLGQFAFQPHYLDLPVYEALRQLGPQEKAWGSIPLENQVLMLCSYDKDYYSTWQNLSQELGNALYARNINTRIERLQDLPTPQLVSQALYERIRRCAGCIADWTLASPSTFFEIGVRLAVSQWSLVQILDEKWLKEKPAEGHYAKQFERMRALLDPLLYQGEDDAGIGSRMAQQLIGIRGRSEGPAGHWLRQAAVAALGPIEERLPNPSGHLMDQADALDHKNRARDNVAQALFYEIKEIRQDYEGSALEQRLAAWLYLEHRVGAARLDDADQRKHTWRELGEIIASDLYNSRDDADQDLADQITQRLT